MKTNIKKLTISAVLIAMQIILSRFLSFQAYNMKIGFSFVPVVIAAYMLGPFYTMFIAAISDVIGAICFPSGSFFIGFTVTAVISGFIYSLFLYKKKAHIKNIIIMTFINQIICSLLLNTFWISILYKTSFIAILVTRLLQSLIMTLVIILVTSLICFSSNKIINKLKLEVDRI